MTDFLESSIIKSKLIEQSNLPLRLASSRKDSLFTKRKSWRKEDIRERKKGEKKEKRERGREKRERNGEKERKIEKGGK